VRRLKIKTTQIQRGKTQQTDDIKEHFNKSPLQQQSGNCCARINSHPIRACFTVRQNQMIMNHTPTAGCIQMENVMTWFHSYFLSILLNSILFCMLHYIIIMFHEDISNRCTVMLSRNKQRYKCHKQN